MSTKEELLAKARKALPWSDANIIEVLALVYKQGEAQIELQKRLDTLETDLGVYRVKVSQLETETTALKNRGISATV